MVIGFVFVLISNSFLFLFQIDIIYINDLIPYRDIPYWIFIFNGKHIWFLCSWYTYVYNVYIWTLHMYMVRDNFIYINTLIYACKSQMFEVGSIILNSLFLIYGLYTCNYVNDS